MSKMTSPNNITINRLKTAQNRGNLGTATRLTTGLQNATRKTGINITRDIKLEDRPITQQGVSGLKTASKGPRRQVEDKAYYIGLVRRKINEIQDEITKIKTNTEDLESASSSYLQYEQMAEKLAISIEELQGELGDYNTLVEKAAMGGNVESVQMDLNMLKEANSRFERSLEVLFESRQDKEAELKKLEVELDQDRQLAENVLLDMKDSEREKYRELKIFNEELLKKLHEFQREIENLNVRKSEFEDEISASQIKQECLKLYVQLRELEVRREQLQAEDAAIQDPQLEKEKLLKRVKEDNQEIAQMEKEISVLEERSCYLEDQLAKGNPGLFIENTEKQHKLGELRKQEQNIDEFCGNFEKNKEQEEDSILSLEQEIANVLTNISKNYAGLSHLNGINDPDESININAQSEKDNSRSKLKREILKLDQLARKLKEEKKTLLDRIKEMENEVRLFSDFDNIRVSKNEKKKELINQKDEFERKQEQLEEKKQKLNQEFNRIQRDLNSNESYMQIKNLEKRWSQLEQVNYSLTENIQSKKDIMDYTSLRQNVEQLITCFNKRLINQLN